MTADVAALLAQARRPERTVPVCLRGDLQAEFEQLDRQLDEAVRRPQTKLVDDNGAPAIAARIEALRAEMAEATVEFRLRALPRPQWRDLQGKHVKEDGSVNVETMASPLIRACTVAPELTDEQWDTLLSDSLTDGQYEALFEACWMLNKRPVDVPFSRAASLLTQGSEQS